MNETAITIGELAKRSGVAANGRMRPVVGTLMKWRWEQPRMRPDFETVQTDTTSRCRLPACSQMRAYSATMTCWLLWNASQVKTRSCVNSRLTRHCAGRRIRTFIATPLPCSTTYRKRRRFNSLTADNGPFETTLGTHRMNSEEAMEAYLTGQISLHAIPMELGDVMIRDVRALHRGTPNNTDAPRPMVVIGYSRSWYFRPEVHIDVPRDVYQRLGPRAKRLLRYMPQVDDIGAVESGENYLKFAY
jgi:hypothetical protein